jgi:WD40 repeat protein
MFSPDGKYVAASHYDGAVRIWDVRLVRRVRAHVDLVNDIYAGRERVISGCRDMTLRYWAGFGARSEVEAERQFSGHEVRRFYSLFLELTFCIQDSVYSLAISFNGKWVASGSDDQIWIWDTRTATVEYILDFFPTMRTER